MWYKNETVDKIIEKVADTQGLSKDQVQYVLDSFFKSISFKRRILIYKIPYIGKITHIHYKKLRGDK